ncbi:hypothetical protein C471_04860 [Halorubrum saccharovorum DSM 1137]|uniref:Uncharacterized protein n=1 Tax=Halorubrum saccharovorum DSM 1137 TaxID=1227484 RepID=M0E3H8_9EURY|nr:hypothetical protein [Halorubrum saccharovorum]ELZ42341.1 hypothetical protein C471_04860 [Halorubrum saccharovorum DSM 1137]
MEPEEAVRQLECAIDASLDETGQRTAATYRPTFERVADRADGGAVYALAGALADEVVAGDRPTPAEANATAERVLDDWAYTDGGA